MRLGGAPPAGRGSARPLRALADLPRPQPAQHGHHLSLLRHLPRGRFAGRGSASLRGAGLQPAVHGRPALRRAALQAFGRRAGAGAGAAAVCHLPAVSLLHLRAIHRCVLPRVFADDPSRLFQGAGRGKPAGAGGLRPAVRAGRVFRRAAPLHHGDRGDCLPDCGAV